MLAAPAAGAKPSKASLPNLLVVKVSKPPATSAAGAKLKLSVAVANKGRGAAGKSRLGVYLAKGKKHKPKDTRLATVKVEALAPGRSAKLRLELPLPGQVSPGAYRLFACADDTERLHEAKESDNCLASKPLAVSAPPPGPPGPVFPPPGPPAPGPPAPAFSMADGIEWVSVRDADGNFPGAMQPVTVTMRAANGLPGQAGYTRSTVAPQPLLGGATTLDYSGTSHDDGAVSVTLPFAFPFGGIGEQSVSVGTNGWVGFGAPAADFWNDTQRSDYRGANAVIGAFERAIMPYWGDLDLRDEGAGTGTVTEAVAADGSSVAFQWDIGQHGAGNPRRVLQLVLFRDGRFRFDYPGTNTTGGNEAFIGYSLGTGAAGLDAVGTDVEAVPSTSLLFTPKPVPAPESLPAGQATLTLPAGSAFVSGDPECAVSKAPETFIEGLVSCPVPGLAPGQQVTKAVIFAMPDDAAGQSRPANVHLLGSYASGGSTLTDDDEIDVLENSLPTTTIVVTPEYTSPALPTVAVPATFTVTVKSGNLGLADPKVTFGLPANTALDSIQIAGQPIDCDPPVGVQVTCRLPNGLRTAPAAEVKVTVTPSPAAANAKMTLGATAQALNAPPETVSVDSPLVGP